MEDWEKEYEEDRRRMAEGKDVGARRPLRDDDDPFQERRENGYVAPNLSSTATPAPPASGANQVGFSERGKDEDSKIEELYAQYRDDAPPARANLPSTVEIDPGVGDLRFGLRYVNIPSNALRAFGEKFGKTLFFCEPVKGFFKGFFSPNDCAMYCFVTSRCIYLGDEKTGEVVLCRSIPQMKEIQVLGDQGLGLRGDKSLDWYMTTTAERKTFVDVVTRIGQYWGVTITSRTLSIEGEKSFKKEIRYVDRKEASWTVEEDPRSGLLLAEVPEQHQAPYGPIVPKILHWFGGVFHIVKDWKGGNSQERRGCWLTATALFLSKPTGPQTDGRDITRCMGIEFMQELIDGPDTSLGLISDKDGPPQPHLALMFDNVELKRKMVTAIQACYEFRKKVPIKVTKSLSLEAKLKIEKEKDFKPHLFMMKTRSDLYGLLRGKN